MSSTPSGRFQSRVLRLLSENSRRWFDRSDRALRHARMATLWGVQVFLYPLYALFQATRLVGRPLQATVDRGLGALPLGKTQAQSPDCDAPIQRVLLATTPWLSIWQSLLHPQSYRPLKIPGRSPAIAIGSREYGSGGTTIASL
ncbi:hypothetical protein DO97_06550 [Neosynechococcus sphagnicola sy1]|uniref:Uncharacterized protein n=1 Tax=Neosynechococcus sphagnicola sy1 TaxID=1497020 RepID=A0A098TLD0_9CYAN|nr:hypothetical protein DO97_06550 [Neosynechococcus sphagnicola sy1]